MFLSQYLIILYYLGIWFYIRTQIHFHRDVARKDRVSSARLDRQPMMPAERSAGYPAAGHRIITCETQSGNTNDKPRRGGELCTFIRPIYQHITSRRLFSGSAGYLDRPDGKSHLPEIYHLYDSAREFRSNVDRGIDCDSGSICGTIVFHPQCRICGYLGELI